MMACVICTHEKRADIEHELLCRSMGDLSVTLESVAKKYKVKAIDLQVHSLMHQTLPTEEDKDGVPTTLVAAVKFKEAEYIRQAITEYQNTLNLLGVKIREIIRSHTDDNPTLHKLSRPTVDLYLGLGSEIRGAVDTLVKMNNLINGEDNSGMKGLVDLVTAINNSGKGSSNDTV